MKKVLCLIDSLGSGGAERQMAGLAVLLKSRGYDVTLAAYHVENFYSKMAIAGGVIPIVLPVKNNPLSKFLAVRKFLIRDRYETLITYKSGPNAIGCLLKCLGVKIKLIVSERSFSKTQSRRDKICFFLYRYSDFIVPNSYSQANFIKNHFRNLSYKTITITNFTDTDVFTPKERKQNEVLTIVTVARIAKVKNVLNYLDAITLLKKNIDKKIHFDWYGDVHQGAKQYFRDIQKKIEDNNLQDIITFHPATNHIVEKYQKCDIFCLPSIYEGFPNVICEAMSCGKPIVCSGVCDNPQIVEAGQNGAHFDPYDVHDIYNKLNQIIHFPELTLNQWGKKSREMAEKMFSKDAFIDKYIALIERD